MITLLWLLLFSTFNAMLASSKDPTAIVQELLFNDKYCTLMLYEPLFNQSGNDVSMKVMMHRYVTINIHSRV